MTGNIIRSRNMVALLLLLVTLASAADLLIEDFNSPESKQAWSSLNDPVMGGVSEGTVSIEDGVGKFRGEVKEVASLEAPGFITMENRDADVPDLSTCRGIALTARSNTDYAGYHFLFRAGRTTTSTGAPSRYSRGYIQPFRVGRDFQSVRLDFTGFSDDWDFRNGDVRVSCASDASYCPSRDTLKNVGRLEIRGEGVQGPVDLEIQQITAYDCSDLLQLEQEIVQVEHTIAVPIAGVACLVSLVSLFFVWRNKMNEMGGAGGVPVSIPTEEEIAVQMN